MYDFGFRLDLGKGIGSGHFFRCHSIAQELLKHGHKVIFIVNNGGELKKHLTNPFPFYVLKNDSELKKIKQCKTYLENINHLIVDLPFKNELYSKHFKNFTNVTIIDDLGNKKFFSKYLFNGSIVKSFHNYDIQFNNPYVFLGPKYMIIRKEFLKQRKKFSISNSPIKKILLTFGGSDSENLAEKILPFFFKKNFYVTIILGPSYTRFNKLLKISQRYDNILILYNTANLAEIFSKQDLVISSSGITAYELSHVGIPTIFIPSELHEIKTANALVENGFGLNFGKWNGNFKKLEDMIYALNDYKTRKKMFYSGRKLVDGKGLSRIVKTLHSTPS